MKNRSIYSYEAIEKVVYIKGSQSRVISGVDHPQKTYYSPALDPALSELKRTARSCNEYSGTEMKPSKLSLDPEMNISVFIVLLPFFSRSTVQQLLTKLAFLFSE